MKNRIDFVVSYVNPNDKEWQRLATENGIFGSSASNNYRMRYADDGVVELCVESIRKFCDFAGDIYLLLFDSDGQLPPSLKDKVKVIRHSEFIPEQYRPCFNSATLEVFLPFLKGVSEQFIYLNDDMLFLKKTEYDNYFCNDKPRNNIVFEQNLKDKQNLCIQNAYEMIMGRKQEWNIVQTMHGPTPFCMSQLRECYDRFQEKLLASVHPLGRTTGCISQYVYSIYDRIYHNNGLVKANVKSMLSGYETMDWATLSEYDVICMNSPKKGDITKYIDIVRDYIKNK